MAALGWYAWTEAVLMIADPDFIQGSAWRTRWNMASMFTAKVRRSRCEIDLLEVLHLLALKGSVVHEQVDAAELARRGVDQARALRLFGQIPGDEHHAPARFLD